AGSQGIVLSLDLSLGIGLGNVHHTDRQVIQSGGSLGTLSSGHGGSIDQVLQSVVASHSGVPSHPSVVASCVTLVLNVLSGVGGSDGLLQSSQHHIAGDILIQVGESNDHLVTSLAQALVLQIAVIVV